MCAFEIFIYILTGGYGCEFFRNSPEISFGTVTVITVTVQDGVHKVQDQIRNRIQKDSQPYPF